MIWWAWLLVIWTTVNLSFLSLMMINYAHPMCDWCHRRYWIWSSNSSFQNVFCSYRCNYWDLRAFLAESGPMELLEADDYLSRRGYVHPDLVEAR